MDIISFKIYKKKKNQNISLFLLKKKRQSNQKKDSPSWKLLFLKVFLKKRIQITISLHPSFTAHATTCNITHQIFIAFHAAPWIQEDQW